MAIKKVKKSKSSGTLSARDKMLKRKEDLLKKGNNSGLVYIKEGVTRLRLRSQGEDEELGVEIIRFYLGKEAGSIISPATFDEPCPFMEKYRKLKESKNEADSELAKKIVPSTRFIIGGIIYKDDKGKEIDPEKIDKPVLITRNLYQEIIDLYLDEDDWGDMTSQDDGYDIKISRTGSGQYDTQYSVSPCQKKPINGKYIKQDIDLVGMVRAQIKDYDELSDILDKHLMGSSSSSDDDDYKPAKKKKKVRKSDI